MGLVTKTPDALRDLAEIWHFIAFDNPAAADRLIDDFNQRLEMLSDFPGAGRIRQELSPDLRSPPVGNYVLFYRPAPGGGGIELIRVIHGAREIDELFDL